MHDYLVAFDKEGTLGAKLVDAFVLFSGGATPRESVEARHAYEFVKHSSDAGNLYSVVRCAEMMRAGWGVSQSKEGAFAVAWGASEVAFPPGLFDVGHCYMEGIGVVQDVHRAIPLLERSASGGYSRSAFFLATVHKQGALLPTDHDTALRMALLAVELGDPYAPFEVGRWYEEGNGVARDRDRALDMYKCAAGRGNALAHIRLSMAYRLGDLGLRVDPVLAERFLQQSAAASCP